jgi:hypothetical protein
MNVGMPPRSRNHRLPAADGAPTASAASSLLEPSPIRRQNHRSTSRRSDGAPGDFTGALPLNSIIHSAGLPIATLLHRAFPLNPPTTHWHRVIDTEDVHDPAALGPVL